MAVSDTVALEVSAVSKSFPGVRALDNVALTLRAGEIHALIGENGAGKSTLIKIITGLYQPEAGHLHMNGSEVRFASPREAIEAGISFVPQERNLIPGFSVGENIMLERMPTRAGVFADYRRVNEEAKKWLDVIGLDVSPTAIVSSLSAAQMQLVETARALSLESRVLLLDEPTASITPHETVFLFNVLRGLRDRGVAILFVSHKMEEVFDLCDRVTVLRDGRNTAANEDLAAMDRDRLVSLMIGRTHIITELPAKSVKREQPALRVRGLQAESGTRGVDFDLYGGEVLGLYGLVGAGRSELANALIGASRVTAGEILVNGGPAHIHSVADAVNKYGIGYVSENRKTEGLILSHTIIANVSITIWRRIAGWLGWISGRTEKSVVSRFVGQLDIKTPSLNQLVNNLSGGNQQKVSLAKWLAAEAKVLIIDEPTIGIDIKTKYALHELIWELAGQGRAILLISSEMPEMIRLADRILVMKGHRIVAEFNNTHQYDEISSTIIKCLT
ncbi:MAG: sugar ABC transporter ATP-binding protein [Chloroflexi bacterium]|nr:sugar ABC transporter ATP-binding protein [Chloroflexota bacterium]